MLMTQANNRQAVVDQDKCIGCNTCPLIDPDTFEMDEITYKSIVKPNAPPVNDKTQMACDSCPVNAISIVE